MILSFGVIKVNSHHFFFFSALSARTYQQHFAKYYYYFLPIVDVALNHAFLCGEKFKRRPVLTKVGGGMVEYFR